MTIQPSVLALQAHLRAAVDRYAVTLTNSRIPLRHRAVAERNVVGLLATPKCRDWYAHWFASTISQIVTSLPRQDPWRNLDSAIGTMRYQQGGESWIPEDDTGSWTQDRRRFGAWHEALDLVLAEGIRTADDVSRDPALAAFFLPLNFKASALLGLAAYGDDARYLDPLLLALGEIFNSAQNDFSDEKVAQAAHEMMDAPLRWAVDRRMQYVGAWDPFISHASDFARRYADREVLGIDVDDPNDLDVHAAWAGKIDDDFYDAVKDAASLLR